MRVSVFTCMWCCFVCCSTVSLPAAHVFNELGLVGACIQEKGSQANDGRVPLPNARQVAAAKRKISRIFSRELNARDLEQKKQTIEILIKTGLEETDEVMQFALLQKAHQLAVEICDSDAANRAIDETNKRFQIDFWDMHLDSLKKLSRSARTAAQLVAVLKTYEVVVQGAANQDRFTNAIDLTDSMIVAARKLRDSSLNVKLKNTREYLQFAKKIYDRWQDSVATNAPTNDIEFNRGLFLFFVRDDQEMGMKLMALKPSSTVGSLAAKEFGNPDAHERVKIARRWIEWADGLSSRESYEKKAALAHAVGLLNSAVADLKGLEKQEIKNQIEKLHAALNTKGIKSGGVSELVGFWSVQWSRNNVWKLRVDTQGTLTVVDRPFEFITRVSNGTIEATLRDSEKFGVKEGTKYFISPEMGRIVVTSIRPDGQKSTVFGVRVKDPQQ